MSFRRSIEQLRPARTQKIAIVEQAQNYLRELTISPHYQQKGNLYLILPLENNTHIVVLFHNFIQFDRDYFPVKCKYIQ